MDEKITQFASVTGADADRAKFFVESANGDVEAAVATYFESGGAEQASSGAAAGDEGVGAEQAQGAASSTLPNTSSSTAPSSSSSGPRTLSGAPAEPLSSSTAWPSQQQAAAAGSSRRKQGTGFSASGGVASLADYRSEQPRRGGGNDSDDGDDGDGRDPENLYAGGERSGLSVQNPDMGRRRGGGQPDAVQQILEQARRAGMRGGRGGGDDSDDDEDGNARPAAAATSNAFSGAGRTIGDAGAPEATSANDNDDGDDGSAAAAAAAAASAPEEVERTLTFWEDGFSIGDGPLWPYDEERSKVVLEQIKSGTAPLSLFNVRMGQRVSIGVAHRNGEKYTPPPPPPMQPFGGSGNRLGSPAPTAAATAAAAAPAAPASSPSAITLDSSQPITSLQIRTGDGNRLIGRFNHSHRVADVRAYIDSNTSNAQSSYTLHTSFPPKLIQDEQQTIQEAGLVNAVVIQRFA